MSTHARGAGIRLVIGFSPGSASDIVAGALAPALADIIGRAVQIERTTGANGTRGADLVAVSPPDGRTLFMATLGTHALQPALGRAHYDPLASFAPVALVARAPLVLAVHPSLGVHSVAALMQAARAAPGKLSFASSAIGGAPHLAAELFQALAGVELAHVRYDRTRMLYADLEAGRVAMSFNNVMSMAQRVRSGALYALAVTGAARCPALPDVATLAEAGIAGYEVTNWLGIVAPARTPGHVVDELAGGVEAALRIPEVAAALARIGVDAGGGASQTFATHIACELQRWRPIVARFKDADHGAGAA